MAEIQPFTAIRYARRDVSDVIAPPYDVLDGADKARLLARSDRNIVAIDLPHVPPKEAGPDAAYAAAARTLEAWLADGTLRRDERPAVYVYHQRYEHGGRRYVRKKFFARLRLEEFGAGRVFPHEQTFGGPKADRLKLTTATRCNLSPIFALYTDPAGEIAAALDAATGREPDATGVMDGVENRLWCVSEAATVSRVRERLGPQAVYIADGHHRYGTALNYRAAVERQRGRLAADDAANFVLAVFGAMEDPGALILPTHRVLVDLVDAAGALRAALAGGSAGGSTSAFEWTDANTSDPEAFTAALGDAGRQAIGVFDGAGGQFAIIRPRDADLLRALEPDRSPAWRRLSYAILHRYVIDEVIARGPGAGHGAGGGPPTIHYVKYLPDTLAEARAHRAVAFIMQPCTMAELRDVCAAGELMPQKTTYFHPKLATGMVVNPLY